MIPTPTPIDEEAILGEVVAILVEVIGEDFLLEMDVTADTTFNDDLAVESIEFVALAERLRERYGDRIDFVAFVGALEMEEIVAMTVGDLVAHIRQCLEPNGPELNGPELNGPELNGPELNGPELNGVGLNGAENG